MTRAERFRILVAGLTNHRRSELWEIFYEMENEISSLRAFKDNVDDALNSGDGTYKP